MGMSGSASFQRASLHSRNRYLLDLLLCRSQRNQGYTDDDERSHAHQFSAWDQIAESACTPITAASAKLDHGVKDCLNLALCGNQHNPMPMTMTAA
jgi:hypothetical protein